jgi:hypothetical protein
MKTTTIERIESHRQLIADGRHDRIRPGQPMRFPDAADYGDFIWQGDLKLVLLDRVPNGYEQVKRPTKADQQLVPGNTEGSRHGLDSLRGVRLYRPATWPNGLAGPVLVVSEERVIEHPKHGHVTIPAGRIVGCTYQREWDAEQRQERRNAD